MPPRDQRADGQTLARPSRRLWQTVIAPILAVSATAALSYGMPEHVAYALPALPAPGAGPSEDPAAVATEPDDIAPETGEPAPSGAADASAPARRYGAMDAATCERELRARGVAFERAPESRGVLLPVRLTGPVRGVTYRTALGERARKTSPYEITDCRLALALDDFAKILAAHEIVEVIHYSMYRPPSPRSLAPGVLGTRHAGALAIDAGSFTKKDGTKIDVEKDFHGGIGQRACGVNPPTDPRAKELREIVCSATAAHLFNVALTPDYNWQHRNHFHLEVTPKVSWFIVH
jgi:hypothetical protein